MQIETLLLSEHGWVPNNSRLPVIFYHRTLETKDGDVTPEVIERNFASHGWPARWRDVIYNYDHYHSTAHEVLGIACGHATLMIGGPRGREQAVAAGDALLLPCGTGHRSIEASSDFLVVGGYPEGQDWDICREAPSAEMRRRMASLPFPKSDPLLGPEGPLTRHWF